MSTGIECTVRNAVPHAGEHRARRRRPFVSGGGEAATHGRRPAGAGVPPHEQRPGEARPREGERSSSLCLPWANDVLSLAPDQTQDPLPSACASFGPDGFPSRAERGGKLIQTYYGLPPLSDPEGCHFACVVGVSLTRRMGSTGLSALLSTRGSAALVLSLPWSGGFTDDEHQLFVSCLVLFLA